METLKEIWPLDTETKTASPNQKPVQQNEQLSLHGRSPGLRRQPTKYPHGLGICFQTLEVDQGYSRASIPHSSLNRSQQLPTISSEDLNQHKYRLSTIECPENLAELQVRRYKYPPTGQYYLDTQEAPKSALMWLTYGKRVCRWKYLRWPLIFLASVLLFVGVATYCIWLHNVSVVRGRYQQQRHKFLGSKYGEEVTAESETTETITIHGRDERVQPTTIRAIVGRNESQQESTKLHAISTGPRQIPQEQKLTTLEYQFSKGAIHWDKSEKIKESKWAVTSEATTLAAEEAALVPAHIIHFTSGHQNSFGVPIEEDERILKLINGLFSPQDPATSTQRNQLTRVSPTIPPVQSWKPTAAMSATPFSASQEGGCQSTSLPICRGVLDYDLTYYVVPQLDTIEKEAYQNLFDSNCSARAVEFVCATLEPECRPSHIGILPPCRRVCKAILEACSIIISNSDILSATFDCNIYPDTNDPDKCEDPTRRRGYCYDNEFECNDQSCIPYSWQCDNIKDCSGGEDEDNCIICDQTDEFRCRSNEKCVPESVRCDLKYDCFDGSDEEDCEEFGSGEETALDGAALNSFPRVFSYASFLSPNQTSDKLYTYITATANEDDGGGVKFKIRNHTSEVSIEEVTNNVPGEGPRGFAYFRDSKEIMMTSDSENKFKYSSARVNRSSSKYSTSTTPLKSVAPLQLSVTTEVPTLMPTTSCAPHQLRCVSGKCIAVAQLCDRTTDCPDGADEQGCVYKNQTSTVRNNGTSTITISKFSSDKRTVRTTIKRKVKT